MHTIAELHTLSVVRLADAWTVVVQGRRRGRFLYRVDAEEAALRLAARERRGGQSVQVLIQAPWGEMQTLDSAGG